MNEIFYDIIENLCGKFTGLSPFEVMNADTRDVFDLYVDAIVHEMNGKTPSGEEKIWVTSKTATWH